MPVEASLEGNSEGCFLTAVADGRVGRGKAIGGSQTGSIKCLTLDGSYALPDKMARIIFAYLKFGALTDSRS